MSQLGPGRERLRIAALGFSILFDPVDATTDLVFVHGLQGHPERTWTYAPGNSHVKKRRPFFRRKDKEEVPSSSEAPVYWPYDLLAKHPDLSKTRIMAYGYDSLVTKFFDANNKQNISEHGNDLMVALEQERKSDAASIRPLIFVAHSLGGILVKVALDNSSRAPQQKFQRLFESTRGVVFLGTPHGGSDVAGLATTVSNLAKLALQDSNQRVLKGLSPGNEMLRHYGKVFLQLIHRGNFGVHTFYETKAMTGVYGITGMVVPRESARIGDVLHEVERGLNANHHEICKFSGPEDEKYRAVSGAIVDYIKDAAKLPVAPALPRPLSPALSTVDSEMTLTQREKSNRKEQEVGQGQTLLVPPMYGASYGKRISPQAEIGLRHDNPGLFLNDLDNALDDYLYALKISESHWEEKEYSTPLPPIDGAQDNSDWFFDSPEFREWESNDSISLLWLGGKSSQENTRVVGCLLQRTLESKASLFHYTHNPAARNEKLSPGAEILETVRELIRQIVEEECDRMLFAMNHYPRSKLTKSAPYSVSTQDWELRHLMTVLVYCLVAVPHQPTYLLVDGFNLSDANVNRFLGQLVRLLDDGREDHTNVILKVLFTSGPRSVPRPLSESDKRLASIPYIDKDKELQDCLQSLYSTNFDARPGTILDADDFTFDWLWEDDTFRHWQTAEKSSLLLIQGKAGSGKSTLAKRILKGIPRPTPSLREDDTENTDISSDTSSDISSTNISASAIEETRLEFFVPKDTEFDNLVKDVTLTAPTSSGVDEKEQESLDAPSQQDAAGSNVAESPQKSSVAEDALQKRRTVMAHFFYSFRGGKAETSHEGMLRSILYQLLSQDARFYPLFREHYRALRQQSGGGHWGLPLLLQILQSMSTIDEALTVFIVLDAMDESDDEQLPQILQAMASLCATKGRSIFKGLMTTRPLKSGPARQRAKQLTPLVLALEEKNQEAISRMVDKDIQQIIDDILEDDESVELTVFDSIKQYIKSHADGVFLWVSMVMKEVKNLSEEGWTETSLEELKTILPAELMDIYKRMTRRIADSARPEAIKLGRKILACSVFSRKRLTVEETRDAILVPTLSEATEFEPSPVIFKNRIQLLQRRIPMVCGDLVEVKTPFVQLIHESVREFLLGPAQRAAPFDFQDPCGQDDQASICLRYLRLSLSRNILDKAGIRHAHVATWADDDYSAFIQLLNDRPFLSYTLSYLSQHLSAAKSETIKAEAQAFVEELRDVPASLYLVTGIWLPADSSKLKIATQVFCDRALRIAAKTNQVCAIEALAISGADVNGIDPSTGTLPLIEATVAGHTGAVRLLLTLGADADMRESGRYREAAIHKAARLGHTDIARTLIQSGASQSPYNMLHETPLHLAARFGHVETMAALLPSADANTEEEKQFWFWRINAQDRFDATPLHEAAANGHLGAARLLLELGARPGIEAKYIGTSLDVAVDRGDAAMAKLILGEIPGRDSEDEQLKVGEYGATPLHVAATGGHRDIVRIVLDKWPGSHRWVDRYGWLSIDWARRNGHDEVVRMLEEHAAATMSASASPQPAEGVNNETAPVERVIKLFL